MSDDQSVFHLTPAEAELVKKLKEEPHDEILRRLKADLQTAIQIELATIPIYLYTYYSIERNLASGEDIDPAELFANKAGGVKSLAAEAKPAWVSDHLCWTGVLRLNSRDLLPLPLTEETLAHVAARVRQVQDTLERPIILENPSTYLAFTQSTISEPDFLRELAARTGCGLLLDVNNVFVTCYNSDADPSAYLESFPCEHVVQMHLAGHQHCGTHIIDTHDRPVLTDVWELFRFAWQRTGGVSTLLEWDGNIPPFESCHAELLKANQYMSRHFAPLPVPVDVAVGAEAVSNPVDFMMPHVMRDAVWEEA